MACGAAPCSRSSAVSCSRAISSSPQWWGGQPAKWSWAPNRAARSWLPWYDEGRWPDRTRCTSRPSTVPAAAVIRQWLDCPAPTVTRARAPARNASAHRNSSLRALLPPAPRPVRSSRLTHSRAPPGSPGPRSSGVGSVARRERATSSIDPRTAAVAPSSAGTDIAPMVGMGAVTDQARTDWNPLLRGEFAKPYWPDLQSFVTAERRLHTVYPPHEEVFAALHLTPYAE